MGNPIAVAYFRTSSAANVGADKDSEARQRDAVTAYAKSAKLEVVAEFYDAAVSGADPVDQRPGFVRLLDHCATNGVGIVLVENASRFARDLVVQLTGHALLLKRGIELAQSPHRSKNGQLGEHNVPKGRLIVSQRWQYD
jgi:DNA invertase Pin-like site-specific DNA recombinase